MDAQAIGSLVFGLECVVEHFEIADMPLGTALLNLAQQTTYDVWQARAMVKASKSLSGIKALNFQAA